MAILFNDTKINMNSHGDLMELSYQSHESNGRDITSYYVPRSG